MTLDSCNCRHTVLHTSIRVRALPFLQAANGLFADGRDAYPGQEIGMINLPMDFPLEEYKDVRTVNKFKG